MPSEILELFDFLDDKREDVRQLATQHCASLSANKDMTVFFNHNNYAPVRKLMEKRNDVPMVAHDAFKALINLSAADSTSDVVKVMDDDLFIRDLVLMLVIPNSILSDLCCMLLSNMTKNPSIALKLIPDAAAPPTEKKSEEVQNNGIVKTQYLDNLLEVFVRGDSKKYNPNATFHFLSCVFSNVSALPLGAAYFLAPSAVDGSLRLSKVWGYTEHPDEIRRGGCVSTIKNCMFLSDMHRNLLTAHDQEFITKVLLPLCGSEEFDLDDVEGMPDNLQFLESSKKRDASPAIRFILLKTLLLLTTTRFGRDTLRQIKAYPILKFYHLWESDEKCRECCEKIVDMLMRDESSGIEEMESTELSRDGEVKKKVKIEQVVDSDDDDQVIDHLV